MQMFLSTAYAQESGPAGGPPQAGAFSMFMPLIFIFVIFYFLIFRPQRKQQKTKLQMLANLKRGDEVVTNGGIHGKITDLTDQVAMLQVAANVTIKLDRSQVNTVTNQPVSQLAKN